MSGNRKPWHSGAYARRAEQVRAQANADPSTRCWRTGLTLTEGQAKWGPKVRWQAGHPDDGATDLLAAELSTPNQSAGATMGNLKRQGKLTIGTPSRRW